MPVCLHAWNILEMNEWKCILNSFRLLTAISCRFLLSIQVERFRKGHSLKAKILLICTFLLCLLCEASWNKISVCVWFVWHSQLLTCASGFKICLWVPMCEATYHFPRIRQILTSLDYGTAPVACDARVHNLKPSARNIPNMFGNIDVNVPARL